LAEAVAALVARVRAAFPGLAFSRAEINEKGEDHQALVLDDRYVFRFPRHPEHPTGLAFERAVLSTLKGRCALPLPDYRYVSPDGDFAGYEMIQGVELTPQRFAGLGRAVQERVLAQAAEFLSAMHRITKAEVVAALGDEPPAWPREETPAGLVADSRRRRLPFIAAGLPALVPAVEGFYARFEGTADGPLRLTHGDMTDDHMLLAREADRLAGVIDFGDAEIGDAAYDVAYFWSYGDWAPAFLLDRYDLKGEDPGLITRSHWHFARYRIARLGEALEHGWADLAAEIAAGLPGLLSSL
jgi:aminoglycoside phosphotransferase (APT) family kinase protein